MPSATSPGRCSIERANFGGGYGDVPVENRADPCVGGSRLDRDLHRHIGWSLRVSRRCCRSLDHRCRKPNLQQASREINGPHLFHFKNFQRRARIRLANQVLQLVLNPAIRQRERVGKFHRLHVLCRSRRQEGLHRLVRHWVSHRGVRHARKHIFLFQEQLNRCAHRIQDSPCSRSLVLSHSGTALFNAAVNSSSLTHGKLSKRIGKPGASSTANSTRNPLMDCSDISQWKTAQALRDCRRFLQIDAGHHRPRLQPHCRDDLVRGKTLRSDYAFNEVEPRLQD